ncbi:MAG: hypothetical protein LBP72_00880, partial [Dysgonamonadaceae bacterium]|nr:hypothetical protein [Dysgonamonadaceae bacterium]
MKKTILVMLVAVFGMGFVNAQIYVGGSLGFTSGNTDPENGDKLGTSSFSFSPEVGYSLSPDFEVGIALEILNEKEDLTPDTESKSSGWGLAPYARYSFVEFGKFSVWGSAALAFGGGETGVGDNT